MPKEVREIVSDEGYDPDYGLRYNPEDIINIFATQQSEQLVFGVLLTTDFVPKSTTALTNDFIFDA